jgi:hypothetical protein
LFKKAMITLLNFLRYRQGVSTLFSSDYESHMQGEELNQGADVAGGSDYRQAPFNNNMNASYQQPAY